MPTLEEIREAGIPHRKAFVHAMHENCTDDSNPYEYLTEAIYVYMYGMDKFHMREYLGLSQWSAENMRDNMPAYMLEEIAIIEQDAATAINANGPGTLYDLEVIVRNVCESFYDDEGM